MIYPTEMTLTTGTTVYAGDPASNLRIQSREVRVSVTFQIEEEDIDLTDLAHAKAAEVERARMAALERIERDRNDQSPTPPERCLFDPSGLVPPDEDGEEGTTPDPFPQEADYLADRCGPATDPCDGDPVPTGHIWVNGHAGSRGIAVPHPAPPWIAPNGSDKTQSDKAAEAETDWATRPQVLALGSHFRRLGLSPQDQTALLRGRFGKFRLERLTRDEAATLMRSLERGELKQVTVTTH